MYNLAPQLAPRQRRRTPNFVSMARLFFMGNDRVVPERVVLAKPTQSDVFFKQSMEQVMAAQPLVSMNWSRSSAISRGRYRTKNKFIEISYWTKFIARRNAQETP
jgi:hypothetical protein